MLVREFAKSGRFNSRVNALFRVPLRRAASLPIPSWRNTFRWGGLGRSEDLARICAVKPDCRSRTGYGTLSGTLVRLGPVLPARVRLLAS
jgi:hypothetical protein